MKVYTVNELATILNLEGKSVVVSGSMAKVEQVSCLEQDVMLTDDNLVVHITYGNGRRNVVRPSEIENLFGDVGDVEPEPETKEPYFTPYSSIDPEYIPEVGDTIYVYKYAQNCIYLGATPNNMAIIWINGDIDSVANYNKAEKKKKKPPVTEEVV